MSRLRNVDISDRELLLVIRDVADKESGLTDPEDVAERLGITSNGKRTPAGTVSSRLARMSTHKPTCPPDCTWHYGYVERVDPRSLGLKASDRPRYLITDIGRELMSGRLPRNVLTQIKNAGPGKQLLMMRELSRAGYVEADFAVATAVRREWLHNVARRLR